MIPDVVWKNVYRTDEAHLSEYDCELIKFTFYNDQTIKLEVRFEEFPNGLSTPVTITPLCDDFEEWCATAIMTCDAGEDIWDRPNPDSDGMGNMTATEVRARQMQMQQSLQGAMGGQSSGLAQGAFGSGLLSGLAQGLIK